MASKNSLSRQRKFIDEYLKDRNATQAAIRAGYSERSAYSQGQRLLKHAEVGPEIERRIKEAAKRAQITPERIFREEKRLATADFRRLFDEDGTSLPPREIPDDIAACISGVDFNEVTVNGVTTKTYKYRFWNKGAALERLEKLLKMHEADNDPGGDQPGEQTALTDDDIVDLLDMGEDSPEE